MSILALQILAVYLVFEFSGLMGRGAEASRSRLVGNAAAMVAAIGAFAWPLMGWLAWLALVLVAAAHQGVRRLVWAIAPGPRQSLSREAAQLVCHLLLLLGWLAVIWHTTKTPTAQTALAWGAIASSEIALKGVVGLAGITVAIGGGTVLIRALLAHLGKEIDTEKMGVGRVIGDLERILIFLLALEGQLGAVGLVLTAKSLARFEDFKQQEFAEYYLVGTLSSTLVALISATAVTSLWQLIPQLTP